MRLQSCKQCVSYIDVDDTLFASWGIQPRGARLHMRERIECCVTYIFRMYVMCLLEVSRAVAGSRLTAYESESFTKTHSTPMLAPCIIKVKIVCHSIVHTCTQNCWVYAGGVRVLCVGFLWGCCVLVLCEWNQTCIQLSACVVTHQFLPNCKTSPQQPPHTVPQIPMAQHLLVAAERYGLLRLQRWVIMCRNCLRFG